MRFPSALVLLLLALTTGVCTQNWKQVHRNDEIKWQKATGMDFFTIHKLWRAASNVPKGEDDESRIANLDLEGLAERHHILLVTYAGEKNCLTLTVFNQLSGNKFNKVWWVQQPPGGGGFCDTAFGSTEADAANGAIRVRVPHSNDNGNITYTVYTYEWNGVTYRLAAQQEMLGR